MYIHGYLSILEKMWRESCGFFSVIWVGYVEVFAFWHCFEILCENCAVVERCLSVRGSRLLSLDKMRSGDPFEGPSGALTLFIHISG